MPGYKQAVRNCPWVVEFWTSYVRAQERLGIEHEETVGTLVGCDVAVLLPLAFHVGHYFGDGGVFDCFQYEIQQGKAWEIWSRVMTSGRQMVGTRRQCPTGKASFKNCKFSSEDVEGLMQIFQRFG